MRIIFFATKIIKLTIIFNQDFYIIVSNPICSVPSIFTTIILQFPKQTDSHPWPTATNKSKNQSALFLSSMRLYEHSQTENASTRTIAIDEKKKKKNRRRIIVAITLSRDRHDYHVASATRSYIVCTRAWRHYMIQRKSQCRSALFGLVLPPPLACAQVD